MFQPGIRLVLAPIMFRKWEFLEMHRSWSKNMISSFIGHLFRITLNYEPISVIFLPPKVEILSWKHCIAPRIESSWQHPLEKHIRGAIPGHPHRTLCLGWMSHFPGLCNSSLLGRALKNCPSRLAFWDMKSLVFEVWMCWKYSWKSSALISSPDIL